ncbi:MAG TPA: hypothetical protein VE398_20905, partial [Acidobacteriota bacterium]|nr:hypothetical protein [Acidobacteriota bacterium]
MANLPNPPTLTNRTEVDPSPAPTRPRRHPLVLWSLANFRWVWPILVVAVVVAVSWTDLRAISYRQVRFAIRNQDPSLLALAAVLTLLNLAIMGLYDVVCLRATKVRVLE